MTAQRDIDAGLEGFRSVKRMVSALEGTAQLHVGGVPLEVATGDEDFAESICEDVVLHRLSHDLLQIGCSSRPAPNLENVMPARSSYRTACGPHAPQGEAARPRAGVGAACA